MNVNKLKRRKQIRGDAGAEMVDLLLSGKSHHTIHAYRQDLSDFRSFSGATDDQDAVARLVVRGRGEANLLAAKFRADLLARGIAPATINRRLSTLKALVKLARRLGLIDWHLEVDGVRHVQYRDTRGPGKQAVKKMMHLLESRSGPIPARNLAIIHLLYDLALRRGEVVGLDHDDIDLDRGEIKVLGKGRLEKETLFLPGPTGEVIRSWLNHCGAEPGPLFVCCDRAHSGIRLSGTSVYRIIVNLGRQVGVRARPHGIRHTAITEAVKLAQAQGIGIEGIMDFSRHRNLGTLLVYRDRMRNRQLGLAKLLAN